MLPNILQWMGPIPTTKEYSATKVMILLFTSLCCHHHYNVCYLLYPKHFLWLLALTVCGCDVCLILLMALIKKIVQNSMWIFESTFKNFCQFYERYFEFLFPLRRSLNIFIVIGFSLLWIAFPYVSNNSAQW